MINDCKDITLIDELENKRPILHFRFNDDLTLEFNFLDVWSIFFAHVDTMAQCEYKELLTSSGYIPVHQILCIADCYKCVNKSLLNGLVYDCCVLSYEGE